MMKQLHLGTGHFHRAHQAHYTALANAHATDSDAAQWRITGVSLRSATVRDALAPDGYDYTLAIADRNGERFERIDVIDEVLVATLEPARVRAAIADPQVRLITVTVTEKGYALAADGRLMLHDPRIAQDIASVGAGGDATSVIGLLTAGLAERAAAQAPAVTVLSCDNLSDNGHKLCAAVYAFAAAAGLSIEPYLDKATAFPDSMVDRITPASDDALRARVRDAGLPAGAPVATEAFSEWVIEDDFAGPRPAWHDVGVRLVAEVAPFEQRKLRMLNGAHSCLAYAGTLAGHDYVHEAIADRDLRALVVALMDEAATTLAPGVRSGAADYRDALLARFENPRLSHRLRQIAMDGSLKLPVRVLPVIEARHEQGLPSPACEAALQAWSDFVRAEVVAERPLDDPAAARLAERVAADAGATLSPLELLESTR